MPGHPNYHSGRSVRRSGSHDEKETDQRLGDIDSNIGDLAERIKEVRERLEKWGKKSPDVPNPVVPGAPELVWSPPMGSANHYLQENYPEQDTADGPIYPCVKIRVKLPGEIRLEDSIYTVFLGIVATSLLYEYTQSTGVYTLQADDTANVHPVYLTRQITWAEATQGYCDFRLPLGADGVVMGQFCYGLIVAMAANGGYAETIYGQADDSADIADQNYRAFVAGAGVERPETPTIGIVEIKPYHTDFRLSLTRRFDTDASDGFTNCINFYDKLNVYKWALATAPSGNPDTDPDGNWEEADSYNLQPVVRRVKRKEPTNPAPDYKFARKKFTVRHKKSGDVWCIAQITQKDGQRSPWSGLFSTNGDGTEDAPGYALIWSSASGPTQSAFFIGGASNPISTAATDPMTGSWVALDDKPGSPALEYSARLRFHLTNSSDGVHASDGAAKESNELATLELWEYRGSTLYKKHHKEADILNSTTAKYVDFTFDRAFKRPKSLAEGACTLHLMRVTIKSDAVSHKTVFDGTYGGGLRGHGPGGVTGYAINFSGAAIGPPGAPWLASQEHRQRNSFFSFEIPDDGVGYEWNKATYAATGYNREAVQKLKMWVYKDEAAPAGSDPSHAVRAPASNPASDKANWRAHPATDIEEECQAAGTVTVENTMSRKGAVKPLRRYFAYATKDGNGVMSDCMVCPVLDTDDIVPQPYFASSGTPNTDPLDADVDIYTDDDDTTSVVEKSLDIYVTIPASASQPIPAGTRIRASATKYKDSTGRSKDFESTTKRLPKLTSNTVVKLHFDRCFSENFKNSAANRFYYENVEMWKGDNARYQSENTGTGEALDRHVNILAFT